MPDDFEDDLPEEEEGLEDDFENFDPERYLRRRRTIDRSRDEGDDFNRDIDRDLPISRRGRSYSELPQRNAERGHGRGSRYDARDDDPVQNMGAMGPGLLASIIGLFTGENMGLFKNIIPELGPRLGPLARWVAIGISCVMVFICGLACVGVYFIYTLVNHR